MAFIKTFGGLVLFERSLGNVCTSGGVQFLVCALCNNVWAYSIFEFGRPRVSIVQALVCQAVCSWPQLHHLALLPQYPTGP